MISLETMQRAAQALQTRMEIAARTLKAGGFPSGEKLMEGQKMAITDGIERDQKAINELRVYLPPDSNIISLFPKQ